MSKIEFVSFNQVEPEDLLPIVNEPMLRKHLVDHPIFDSVSIKEWMDGKIKTGSIPGCRVRAVFIGGILAGWCGIQPDDNGFEIAIVISKSFWGFGISIFSSLMCWAKALGHKEIMFHLLETRPEYKALKSKATKVQKTELLGRNFTTYFISVDKWYAE
ncbi:N-acetyltransferase [Thalassomonas haliotis]|uniref:N-acetyltransferase n=1 Tax=Thalassomonas haliotis TaxID=485448 RepID=A0ABY7VKL5_9GAMM|nr:N-acetyltransferase [Thalassomonas haliotis]WDE14016.1 N-acetyltransferase [Thalassomonas haliotis]